MKCLNRHSLIQVATLVIVLLLSPLLWGNMALSPVDMVCQYHTGGQDTTQNRVDLLRGIKKSLMNEAIKSEVDMVSIKHCLVESKDPVCERYSNGLFTLFKQQVEQIRALAYLSNVQINYVQLTRAALIKIISKANFSIENLFKYNIKLGHLSEFEKNLAHNIWLKTFREITSSEQVYFMDQNPGNNCHIYFHENIIPKMTNIFKSKIEDYMRLNPLLTFIKFNKPLTKKAISQAANKMLNYNKKFQKKVNKLVVSHEEKATNQFNPLVTDHEMTLLNFSSFAAKYILNLSDNTQKADACTSWNKMKAQQNRRIKSSIAVGFGTAVTCSVSLFGGPFVAAGGCGPAFVDGVVGTFRGREFAKLMEYASYAGQSLDKNQSFSNDIIGMDEAEYLQRKGNIVAFVNILGLIPVTQGIVKNINTIANAKGVKYVKPTAKQFVYGRNSVWFYF